jgi:hypothetical protein
LRKLIQMLKSGGGPGGPDGDKGGGPDLGDLGGLRWGGHR